MGRGTTCARGLSHIALNVYASPKQVLKDILGQLRKLWALPCDELLYLDSQETANLFLGSCTFCCRSWKRRSPH